MALNITQIKEKYPEYSNMSDEEAAKQLHSKFYSDMPYGTFKAKIGMTSAVETPTEQPAEVEMTTLERMGLAPGGFTPERGVEQIRGLVAPPYQFAKGAVLDPAVGISQLAFNILGSDATAEQFNEFVRQYKEGIETVTGEGLSVPEFAGAFYSPLNRLFGFGKGSAVKMAGKGAAAGATQAAIQPVSSNEFWSDKALQASIGLVLGGAIPATAVGLGKISDILSNVNLTTKAKQLAVWKYLNGMLGENPGDAINKLRNAQEIVAGSKPTAAEVLGATPTGSRIGAEQMRLAAKPAVGAEPSPTSLQFAQREMEQEAARRAALEPIASPRGMTVEGLEAARAAQTKALREQALSSANVYAETAPAIAQKAAQNERFAQRTLQAEGKALTEEAQAIERANNWSPVPGMPQISGRYSPNMERAVENKLAASEAREAGSVQKANRDFRLAQIKSLNDEGYYPLQPNDAVKELDKIMSSPGLRAKDDVMSALGKVKEKITTFTDENGFINSQDLYAVRQDIGNDIRAAMGDKATGQQNLIAKLEKQIQIQMDSAINKAAGDTTWTKYLEKYTKYTGRINRIKLGKAFQNKLTSAVGIEQAGAFAEAVRDSSPLVLAATGIRRDASQVLSTKEMDILKRVQADLSRSVKAKEVSSKIRQRAPETISDQTPNLLSRGITIAKTLVEALQRGSQAKVDEQLTRLMLNPQEMAAFLEVVPKQSFPQLVGSMFKVGSPKAREAFYQRFAVGVSAETAEGAAQ